MSLIDKWRYDYQKKKKKKKREKNFLDSETDLITAIDFFSCDFDKC